MGTTAGKLAFALLLLLILAAPAWAADEVLAHDDGMREGKQSSAGTGHVIAFETPKGKWWLRAVRIHGARYGGGYDPEETKFTITICDNDLQPLTSFPEPYALFAHGGFAWVEFPLPRVIRVPEDGFKVVAAFDPSQTRGVYVGWAKTDETHSTYGLPGQEERAYEADREWMIRAVLAKKPPRGSVKEQLLARDDGEKVGHQSLGGSAHGIDMKRPAGTWWIDSVLVYGQRYGAGYDLRATTFEVAVTDGRGEPLTRQPAPYALFGRERFAWVEVPFSEPVKAPSKFRVVVDFDPHQTKGVYLGYANAKRSRSCTGRVGQSTQSFRKGEWMIRVRLVSEKPPPRPPPGPPAHEPKVYLQDLDFLARTVRDYYPALAKKGVDWERVCDDFEPEFASCPDDATHVLNARRLLAVLGDMHSGVADATVEAHVPSFDGLYGAGMWIAADEGHLVLRALMPDHPLAETLHAGAVLTTIDGRPARVVHEEVRQRLRTWHGWSSEHFLDARLSFQFFPFGAKQRVAARFVNPDGKAVDVELPRWGPGGRGLSRAAVTMPEDLEAKGLAVATKLGGYVGYVRILGGMNDDTRAAFFDALERIKGVQGIILDCREMGGGGDDAAWAMAGRFFTRNIPFKHDPVLKPSGPWQFEGPVVMLQDERMVSSAETFTWALAETRRAVTVGRRTGGATIIPRTFEVPSKIFRFRLGSRDRESSVNGVQPEGIGTAPDIPVPYDGVLLQRFRDPALAAAFDVVRMLVGGAPRSIVVETYAGVLGADPTRLRRALPEWNGYPHPDYLLYGDLTEGLIDALVAWHAVVLESEENPTPDVRGVGRRLENLMHVAHQCGRDEVVLRARKALQGLAKERAAQEAFEAMIRDTFPPSEEDLDEYGTAHGGTRWGNAIAEAFKASGG